MTGKHTELCDLIFAYWHLLDNAVLDCPSWENLKWSSNLFTPLNYAVRMIYVAEKGHGTIKAKQKKRRFKGTVSRDFLLHVFLMNRFLLDPWLYLQKMAQIFIAQGAPPKVSTTPAAKKTIFNQKGFKYFVRYFWLVVFTYCFFLCAQFWE